MCICWCLSQHDRYIIQVNYMSINDEVIIFPTL